tara:strand:+ start:4045 stop:4188 length:144 start_codon:yes stop_codon:yes gene_type:complete
MIGGTAYFIITAINTIMDIKTQRANPGLNDKKLSPAKRKVISFFFIF